MLNHVCVKLNELLLSLPLQEFQKPFDTMIKLVSRETQLFYSYFNGPFEIHRDASKLQLGSVISQKGKPIAFNSRKLNPA